VRGDFAAHTHVNSPRVEFAPHPDPLPKCPKFAGPGIGKTSLIRAFAREIGTRAQPARLLLSAWTT
jgi:hypothetical protein